MAVTGLIFEGILERFPRIKLSMPISVACFLFGRKD
jgi:hypothetical protein